MKPSSYRDIPVAVAGSPAQLPRGISRRRFLWFGGTAALTLALPTALAGCRSERGDEIFRGERIITDHCGRELTIPTPGTIERVYFTSGLAEVFVFSLNPDLLAGTAMPFSEADLEYLPEQLADLPSLGSLSGNGEIDPEELMSQGVQIIFSISGVGLTAANQSDAERLQKQSGIPVVLVDGSFDKIAESYRFLGDILGMEERAEELAGYLEDVYERVTTAVADIPEEEKISLYYAEGPLGLQTEPNVSQHALCFLVAGARNVAAEGKTQTLGMSNVSLEQVLSWAPEVIIAWDAVNRGGADEIIRTQPAWSTIPAVQNNRVYTMPDVPFAWCDRPPGVNRFIGIQWVANMLYPDRYDVDMVEATQEFYRTMYWRELTTDQALDILGTSYPPLGTQAKYTRSSDDVGTQTGAGLSEQELENRQSGGY